MKTTTILNIVKEEIKYNGEGGKAHEQSIADLLISLGFTEVDRKGLTDKKTKAELLVGNFDNVKMPARSFVREPLGCRAPVDFLINADELFVLEAKSSKGGPVAWNDNPPKPYFYYIVSEVNKENTVSKGSDWISEDNFNNFYLVGNTVAEVFRVEARNGTPFKDVVERLETAYSAAVELSATSGFEYHPRRMAIEDKEHYKAMTK